MPMVLGRLYKPLRERYSFTTVFRGGHENSVRGIGRTKALLPQCPAITYQNPRNTELLVV